MRRSLRTKWTLGVLAVAVVPLLLLAALVLEIQRRGLDRAEKELEAAVVDEAATDVLAALDRASDAALRAKAIFEDTGFDVDARTRLLRNVALRTNDATGLAFFDAERRFVDAIVTGPSVDPALRNAPDGEGEGFRVAVVDGTPVLRYEARLDGSDGVRGYVVVPLGRAALTARLESLSVLRFGAPNRVYLVDESLRVMAGAARVPERPPAIFASSTLRGTPRFSTALVLTTEFEDLGVTKVGTIRTLPAQRWALVVERPTAEAFGALESAKRAFLLGLIGAAAVALFAGVLVAGRALGPIAALVRLVQRYGRREFGARSDVHTGDELETLGTSLERMADDLAAGESEIARRARIETNLRRYMPEEAAADVVARGAQALDLGGAKRRATIVFADVVAFTGFAERASPERAVAFLNELFTMLSEIVFRHGGMVDKFVGDAVMAVFRPKADGSDDVGRALDAAEDMHAFVASNLPRWQAEYGFEVALGIGVASGEVLMGNLGSTTRMEYTAIGDVVNVAARLEALARPRQTLTTREVVLACPGVDFVALGAHALRGRTQPVEIWEVAP